MTIRDTQWFFPAYSEPGKENRLPSYRLALGFHLTLPAVSAARSGVINNPAKYFELGCICGVVAYVLLQRCVSIWVDGKEHMAGW
jgi:hypothetical protein